MNALLDLLEREYEFRRELEARITGKHGWLLAWAQMMHEFPPEKFFGNGLWFDPGFTRTAMEVPPRV